MTAALVFLIIVGWLASIAVGSYLGQDRHNIAAGVLMPLALGWIGTAIVACLPDRQRELYVNVEADAVNAIADRLKGGGNGS